MRKGIPRGTRVAWLFLALAGGLWAQDPPCAIQVELRTPAGTVAPEGYIVDLLDRSGTRVARTSTRDGKAEFCDVEKGWYYAIRVGDGSYAGILGSCRSTVVENIRLSQSQPAAKITIEVDNCGGVSGFGSNYWPCTARLCVRDGDSTVPLPEAVLTNLGGNETFRKTDFYFELYFERDLSRKILIEAPGYDPMVRTISCEHRTDRREIPIRLYRREQP